MNRRDLVQAIAACEAAAKVFRAALGAEALAEWEEQQTAPTWRMPGVTVTCAVTHPSVQVVDDAKWLDWVRRNYPTEIETRVRSAWQKGFLDSLVERGDPPCADDGEVIPGLAFSPGGAFKSLSIRTSTELAGRLTLLAREMVEGRRPLALPSPEVGDE